MTRALGPLGSLQAQRYVPPSRTSPSLVVMAQPGGANIQRGSIAGSVIASQTSSRGALKVRVMTMRVSVGVATVRAAVDMVCSCGSWVLWIGVARVTASAALRGAWFLRFHFFEEGVEGLEAPLPVLAEL